jgi:GntR family transcriptional regulator, transcriptional repressor for pyruvate dehydrogenase complex
MRTACRSATLPGMTDEELTCITADIVRIACQRMTPCHLMALSSNIAQAASLPARPGWERKATAHAESVGLLGDVTGDPILMRVAGQAIGWTYDLAIAVGPGADWIIRNSRSRLLAHLQAGDAEAAEAEMEHHLRVMRFMERLARGGKAGQVRNAA